MAVVCLLINLKTPYTVFQTTINVNNCQFQRQSLAKKGFQLYGLGSYNGLRQKHETVTWKQPKMAKLSNCSNFGSYIGAARTAQSVEKTNRNLRRSKTKASFFRAFESGPRQGWAVARAVSSCANISSLSCSYPLQTIVATASCLTGLEVSLRRAPKNYPSEGNFLEASRVNVHGRKILPEYLEHSQAI